MRGSILILVISAFVALVASGCSTAPETPEKRQSLRSESEAALDSMTAKNAKVSDFVRRAHGYAVFPNVGKGAAVVGGAYGRGIVYEQGRVIGYAEINQASVGA